jgi:hypothetical protein
MRQASELPIYLYQLQLPILLGVATITGRQADETAQLSAIADKFAQGLCDSPLIHAGVLKLIHNHSGKHRTSRLITRIAFGFRSPEALSGMAMLSPGGHNQC